LGPDYGNPIGEPIWGRYFNGINGKGIPEDSFVDLSRVNFDR
jgi:hypothetical protein